ncbi:MAG: hypothetical protein COA45_12090 [Zetaproteobacteria bacterium]|nr:MAG: hypothetical protein COA45_12090 [Zetaproteobacteria bacterium]
MVTVDDIIVIERPQRCVVFQSSQRGGQFFILPLEPAIARDNSKVSLQLTIMKKQDKITHAFLTVTTTLPMDDALRSAAVKMIKRKFDHVEEGTQINLVRIDTEECKSNIVFGGVGGVSLEGTFQGVGEQRILMNKTLSVVEAEALVELWERGLPDTYITYQVSISIMSQNDAQMSVYEFQEVFGAGHQIRQSTAEHIDVTNFSNNILTLQLRAPVDLSRQDLSRAMIETNL